MGEISIIGAMRDSAEDDKGDGRGLCGQGSVFADFIRCCWLSEGCGRPRRPCHRLLHIDLFRLAVVTAFSLKLAAALGGVEGGSEHSEHSAGVGAGVVAAADSEHSEGAALSVAASASTGGVVVGSEHSERSEHSAGAGAGVALSVVGGLAAVAYSEHSEHSAGVDAGADAEGASVVTAGAAGDSEHSAGVGAGAGAVSVGGGVAAARI